MSIDPNAAINIENIDIRAAQTHKEEGEKQDIIAEGFRVSPEYDTLKEALGDNGEKLLNRIVTQFSMNDENIKGAIKTTIDTYAESLGYSFTDAEDFKKQLLSVMELAHPDEMQDPIDQVLDISEEENQQGSKDIDGSVEGVNYDESTESGKIHNRMANRIEGGADRLNNKLYSQEGREENFHQANNLFFKEGSEFLKWNFENVKDGLGGKDAKENEEWFNVNTKNNGPLEEAFERIQGNFVIPDIEGYDGRVTIRDLDFNPQEFKVINEALSDAFLLEIEEVTLKGAINYDKVKVQALKEIVSDPHSTPLERLMAFGEIHTQVNTSKGKSKQAEMFRRRIKAKSLKTLEYEKHLESIKEQIDTAVEGREKGMLEKKLRAAEALKAEAEEIGGGDIGADWDLDLEGVSESNKKTA